MIINHESSFFFTLNNYLKIFSFVHRNEFICGYKGKHRIRSNVFQPREKVLTSIQWVFDEVLKRVITSYRGRNNRF